MQTPAEIVAVLAAGLMLFVALLRWVVNFIKGYEARRLELFMKYEAALEESVQLRAKLQIGDYKQDELNQRVKFYAKELQRYKNLYEATLDKGKPKE